MPADLESVLGALRSRWRGAPPISVVPHAGALPFAAPADTEAAYHRGEVLLVAEALHPARAVTVLAHEAVAHHGLRQILGRAWPSFMRGIIAGSHRDSFLRGARGHVERIYVSDAGECELTRRQLADEVAAAVVERRMDLVRLGLAVDDPLRKQALAIRGHLRREVLLLDHPVCADQLDGALLLAERRVRHGRAFFGWAARLVDWYAAAMAPKIDFKKPPMSMRESEELLRGAESRERLWEDLKGTAAVFGLYASVILIVVGMGAGLYSILQVLRWLLH